jgi:hypothetical protein
MHPTIGYQLSQNHLAGLRHQAQRAALACAAHRAHRARRARPTQPSHPGPALPALARQALAIQGHHHSPAPAGRTTVLGGSDV